MAHKASLKRKSYADFGQSNDSTESSAKYFKTAPFTKSESSDNTIIDNNVNEKIEHLSSSSDSEGPHNTRQYPSHKPQRSGQRLNIGQKLMSKMGYKEGHGLGKDEQGNVDVIAQSKQKGRRGLGYTLSDLKVDDQYEWNAEREKQFVSVEVDIQWIPEYEKELPNSEEMTNWFKEGPKKTTIDDEDDFCNPEVLKGVILCKNVFDCLSDEELRKARSLSNPFETIEKGLFQNRAAIKMAEVDAAFDRMFTNPVDESGKEMVKRSEILYFADICAGPGGFSEYVLWRKKWHAKGFGFTLRGENDFKLEEFFAGSPETFEPHYGVGGLDGDGDIYKPHNLIAFRDFVLRNTDNLGVHFVMADGGFSVEGQENIQEILSKRLYLCQFLCALAILRPNGSFICKLFDIFTVYSVGLVYLMYRSFRKVTIHKPNSSRPANSERYIVCKWKRNGTTPIEDYLFKLNCHLDYLTNNDPSKDLTEVVPIDIITEDAEFRNYIYDSNTRIGRRQILFLSKVKAYAENQDLLDMRQPELRKKCLKYWDIPLKPRTAPIRNDPLYKFKELIAKNNGPSDYFAYKPKPLMSDNLQTLNFIHGYKCMVLGAENDDLIGMSNSLINFRGFFLGMGRHNIYYWNGSSLSKWIKIETKLELPPETLIYGEQIQELKGEGKAQRKIAAIHIIDALFIGGEDVRDQSFDSRIECANKMVKAVTKPTQTEYAALRVKHVYDLICIEQLFENMDMKECKSGAQRVRLCYEIDNNHDRFMIPYGVLIVNTVKSPWIITWSRSNKKHYYFHTKKNHSFFDCPSDAVSDFQCTFANRMLWKWDSDVNLMHDPINNVNNTGKVQRRDLEKFIDDMKSK